MAKTGSAMVERVWGSGTMAKTGLAMVGKRA